MDPRPASPVPPGFDALSRELRELFREWEASPGPWPEERLDALALRAFRLQLRGNRPYRLYCRRRGIGPEGVGGWRDIPPVPTAAFREVPLCLGGEAAAPLVFRTSGTSRGPRARGRHHVVDPELYRAALEAGFRRHVLGGEDPADGWRVGSLIPPFRPAEDSSLSWMSDAVLRRFGGPASERLAGPDGARHRAADRFAERACGDGVPVCLLATTLAADAWTRHLEERGARYPLPSGSRLMDTGGAKGRPGLSRPDVLARLEERLGLGPAEVVNEFGMTELLSQRYSRPPAGSGAGREPDAAGDAPGSSRAPRAGASADGEPGPRAAAGGSILLHGPPWLRTRALDPVSLEELPDGEAGVLCHLDLANAGSVCAVLTEDLGRVRGDVVEWMGRSAGAPPRGCSLATAELLAAQEERAGEGAR